MLKYVIFLFSFLLFVTSCTPKISKGAVQGDAPKTQAPPPPPPEKPEPPAPLPSANMSSIPMDPSVRIGTLANGMTYYIKANAKPENRAELRMALKAGSMQEDPDQLGLAHFIEHMAFNGTAHFSKNELVNYLERVGSRFGPDLNAYTSFDETVYMLQVRTDDTSQFNKGLLILKDWSEGIAFDSAEIDKERGVVISEWRSGLSPEQRMQQQYLPMLYYNSRYAKRLPIGDPEIVNTAPYPVVKRFYADWYRPELMALVIVGTIDPDQIEKQIIAQFGGIKAKTLARKKESNEVPAHDATFARVITDPEATNANVQLIYNHKYTKTSTVLDYRQRLCESLYNRMLGRRLSDLAKEANPPFIFGYTGYGQDVGDLANYSSFAMVPPKDTRRAYQTLLDENQRVLQHGFTAAELEREKANILRQAEQNVLEESKLESSRIVQRFINHFLDQNPIPNATQHLDMYKSMMPTISVEEISQLAKKWITDKNRVIIITGPEKDKAMYPDSVELISMLMASQKKVMEPYKDVDVSAPLLPGKFPANPVVSSTYDKTLDVHHWSFANGVKVSAKATAFKNDEILMNAYSIGGNSLYGDEMYPSARSTSSVVGSSGIGTFNASALEKKLAGLRVNASPFIFERYEGINGSSSVKDAETLMQMTYSYITAFRQDTTALNSYLSRERGMFANMLSNPQNWYSDKVTRITSQNHPRRGFPAPESYDQIKMEDIMKIYSDRFKDVSDMEFFFVGNFNIDSLKQLTSRYLGALPGGGRKEMWKDVGDRFPKGKVDSVYYRGEAPKSLVQLIYHGADHFNPDTSYVLQSMLDLARIKLREELREDKGGVYGVSIGGGQSKYPIEQYSIRISFNADPPMTNDLIAATYAVIQKIKTEIDTADIAKVCETQRQGRIKDLEQNQFWMGAFINSWMNGTDMAQMVQLATLEQRIKGLNPEVLERAARKYFRENELISVVMFPEKK
jgi:zinc protease